MCHQSKPGGSYILLDFGPSGLCPMARVWPSIMPVSKSWPAQRNYGKDSITGTKTGPFQKSSRPGRAHAPQRKGADTFRPLVMRGASSASVATTVLYTKDSSVTSGKQLWLGTRLGVTDSRRYLLNAGCRQAFTNEMNGCAASILMRVSRGGGGGLNG